MRNVLLSALLAAALGAQAASPPDSATAPPTARKWYRPRHLALQTAGGLGMVAAGVGYVFKKDRLETDILIGYVPKRYAGSTLSLVSVKFMYSPYRVRVAERVQALPLTLGVYGSYTHGTINDEVRGQYSKGYYWFSTDTRAGLLLGGRLTYLAAPVASTGQPRKVSAYYEFGTNDLYIASYFVNRDRGLNFTQILTLALGLKADF